MKNFKSITSISTSDGATYRRDKISGRDVRAKYVSINCRRVLISDVLAAMTAPEALTRADEKFLSAIGITLSE